MKNVYRVLAYLIAAAVAIQAAFVAYGIFGLAKWIETGGTLDKAAFESETFTFPGLSGLILHGTAGIMVIPVLALLFVISSFFTKVKGSIVWALLTLAAVVVQVFLGLFAHEYFQLGALHGINALILFVVAATAGMRIGRAPRRGAAAEATRDYDVPASV